ncbi:galactose-binding domain-like protein [Zychaea mexicana]|uniref:galactose-binding domain-like protein n=1 Tax=Zychaea mexicana TaxID=64656 RepID=UPI0022FF25FC|nr:galactose-binding domain-like protein [Zychaea mexicana]KAI9495310.1 galactose-binding domain-like protein [Zychaea mexicana]
MSHRCHGEHCEHDHDDLPGAGDQFLLYSRIDRDNVRCLNEAEPDSGKSVIKPWNERFDNEKFVESDADEQLILFVPFTGSVKLRSICLRTARGDTAPSTMKVFINRDDVDFDAAESYTPVQTWELVEGSDDVVEYATRITKFTNIRNITLYFPENFGADTSIIHFVGFKGEWTEIKRDPIITVYEANANPADHKIPGADDKMDYSIQ